MILDSLLFYAVVLVAFAGGVLLGAAILAIFHARGQFELSVGKPRKKRAASNVGAD